MRTCGLWLVVAAVIASGCQYLEKGGSEPAKSFRYSGSGPIHIICTTGMVADLVRNVGGERVTITTLMGAGVDPHLYKPSPGDANKLNAADAIFYSGHHLEGKMSDLFVRLARRKPTTPVTEAIPEQEILDDEAGAFDPHLWFDVSLWSQAAGAVRESLSEFDPEHAGEYAARCDAFQKKLAELHTFAKDELAKVPAERRVLVTAHDAFRYFGRAYDLEVRGIQGISTDSEAGVKQINELVAFLAEKKIKAVFVETSVSDKNVNSLVEGCSARGWKLAIGGELFSDAMGAEGTPEGTYEGMIRHNVETIVRALQ